MTISKDPNHPVLKQFRERNMKVVNELRAKKAELESADDLMVCGGVTAPYKTVHGSFGHIFPAAENVEQDDADDCSDKEQSSKCDT